MEKRDMQPNLSKSFAWKQTLNIHPYSTKQHTHTQWGSHLENTLSSMNENPST